MHRLHLIVTVFALMFPLVVFAQNAQTPPPRTISTSGESTVYVAPDEAIVTLGVQSVDADLQRATSRNEESAASLVKAVKSMGIDDKYVATDNLQVELRYQQNGIAIEGYVVRRMYMVTLKDTKKLEQLVSLALRSGANMLEGVQLRSTELRKFRDQARSMAIKAAKEKAVALAGDLECTVGKPVTIGEAGYGYWGMSRRDNNSFSQNSVQSTPQAADGGETLPLGQIGITASVSVTFDLVPN